MIEISEVTIEKDIQDMVNEVLDKYIKHNEINTLKFINERIYVYYGKEVISDFNVWENFNK